MEPNIDTDLINSLAPATISLIVTGLVSVLIGIYFEKFRNKVVFIKYDIQYQPLATSSQTDYWGKIEVFHNGTQKNHLNFVTVQIENDSNTDLEDINIDVNVDQESQILGQSGYYDDSKAAILLEADYFRYYNEVSERYFQDEAKQKNNPEYQTPVQLANEVLYVIKNKKFNVPVFNRGASLTINLLIENLQGQVPATSVNILYKSLKLIRRDDQQTQTGKTVIYSLIIGIVFFIGGLLILIETYPTAKTPLIILFVLSFISSVFGLFFLQLGRWIKKLVW